MYRTKGSSTDTSLYLAVTASGASRKAFALTFRTALAADFTANYSGRCRYKAGWAPFGAVAGYQT